MRWRGQLVAVRRRARNGAETLQAWARLEEQAKVAEVERHQMAALQRRLLLQDGRGAALLR